MLTRRIRQHDRMRLEGVKYQKYKKETRLTVKARLKISAIRRHHG